MNEKVIRQLIYFHKLTQLHYPLIKVNNFAHGSIWALPILCKNQDTQFFHSVGFGYNPERLLNPPWSSMATHLSNWHKFFSIGGAIQEESVGT